VAAIKLKLEKGDVDEGDVKRHKIMQKALTFVIDVLASYHAEGVQSHNFAFAWDEGQTRLALEPVAAVKLPPFITLAHHEFVSLQLQDPDTFWTAFSARAIKNAGATGPFPLTK